MSSPKTKLSTLNLLLALLFISFLSLFFVLFHNYQKTQLVEANEPVSNGEMNKKVNDETNEEANKNTDTVTIQKKDSPYKGIQIVTERSKADHYTLTYPETTNTSVNRAIKKKLYAYRDAYLASGNQNFNGTLAITKSAKYVTFSFKNKEQLATNQKEKITTSFITYDTKNAKIVTLDHILTKQELLRLSKLSSYALQQKKVPLQKANKLTAPMWKNYSKFVLDGTNIKIHYAPSIVQKKSSSISIPLKEVYSKTPKKPIASLKSNGQRVVALTFDDGPHPKNTPKILATLKKHEATATFYMLGSLVNEHPSITKDVFNAGHEIGNHSYSHENLSTLSAKNALKNINKTNAIIKATTGFEPLTVRPPYGARNVKMEKSMHQPIAIWDIDTLDWKTRNGATTFQRIKDSVHSGCIILMHDIQPSSAEELDEILTYLDRKGYSYVTISQLQAN